MSLAVKLALTPVLLAQGLLTRARLPRLPEAEGARQGAWAAGTVLRLLVAGDSSAAGVGVAHQREALAEPLAARWPRGRRCVHWRLLARTGLTPPQTLALLQAEAGVQADVAVVVTGVNDVTSQVPTHRALAARQALADWLRRAAGVRHVAFCAAAAGACLSGPAAAAALGGRCRCAPPQRCAARMGGRRGDVSCVDMTLPLDRLRWPPTASTPAPAPMRWCAEAIARHLAAQASRFHTDDEETHP
jgi:hypothetical protein